MCRNWLGSEKIIWIPRKNRWSRAFYQLHGKFGKWNNHLHIVCRNLVPLKRFLKNKHKLPSIGALGLLTECVRKETRQFKSQFSISKVNFQSIFSYEFPFPRHVNFLKFSFKNLSIDFSPESLFVDNTAWCVFNHPRDPRSICTNIPRKILYSK